MYLSLSRITSMDKMHLIGEFKNRFFKVNLSANKEYQRLRNKRFLEPLPFMSVA